MKILHTVQGYYPHIGGSEELVRKISEELVKRGHDVTVFTSYHRNRNFTTYNGVKIKQYDIKGNLIRGIKGKDIQKYIHDVIYSDFDIMMNYAAQSWHFDLLFQIIDKIKFAKILAPVGYSELKNPKFQTYFQHLPFILKKYDHIIYHSALYQDKIFGVEHAINNYTIIPNFADEKEFLKNNIDFKKKYQIKTKYLFINVSNHYRDKGHSFVIEAFRKACIKDATLIIIGNPTKIYYPISDCFLECMIKQLLYKENLKILSYISREDTIAAFNAADLFLFGSKVECSPLVIFEAMASNTPWISTNVGNVSELSGGCIVKNENEMSEKMRKLIINPYEWEALKKEGYKDFYLKYRLEKIVDYYEELYHRVIER